MDLIYGRGSTELGRSSKGQLWFWKIFNILILRKFSFVKRRIKEIEKDLHAIKNKRIH